ncbi:MAG TPA: AzlC family ABC transporter permease [Candidatus Polarisedimenticolia bacterium]|nr:AzlC family ABC transporter permease [Candidatus Polarisedimenticolia bacterium]
MSTAEAAKRAEGNWRDDFLLGAWQMAPLLLAGIPFALIMGTTAAAKGLSPAETGLMSGFVFAGSAQFIAVGLWTHPVPIFVLIATTWMVNLRHLLMSASIGPQMGRFSRRQSYFGLFFLADEIWAVALRRAAEGKLTPAYYFGQSLPFWVSWVFWSTMGNILGSTIADPSRYGFDYAFVAVFLVILFGFCRNRSRLIPIVVSAATAVIAWKLLPSVWYIFIGGIAGTVAAALIAKPDAAGPDDAR